jgi:hypothetical protein
VSEPFEPKASSDGCICYVKSFAAEAEQLCSNGASEVELAKHFAVSLAQIQLWACCHDDFRRAIQVGGQIADQRVTMALYRRATGYDIEEPYSYTKKDGTPVSGVKTRHIPADPGAAQYWLENRAPELWRNRTEVDHTIRRADARELSDEELAAIVRGAAPERGERAAAPPRSSKLTH